MSNRHNILNELMQISTLVANLSAENPYKIPPGYFEGLAEDVMNRIKDLKEEEKDIPLPVLSADQKNPFEVPRGYFEELADIIVNRIKATETPSPQEELDALSPLLGQIDKKVPFSLPKGYFEELPNDLIAGVNAIDFVNHELDALSPMMSAAKNENVYKV